MQSSRGTSYAVLYLECCPNCSKYITGKKHRETPQSSYASTISNDNWGYVFTIGHFTISVMAKLIVGMFFMQVSIYNAV